jgi:branched-chain amino acid transport system permease protein
MDQFIQQLVNGMIAGSIYALVAMGLALIFGIMYVPNFAIAALYMLGAYASYYMIEYFHLPYLLTIPIGMVIIGLLGILTEKLCFRPVRAAPHAVGFIVALGLMMILETSARIGFGAESKMVDSPYNAVMFLTDPLSLNLQRFLVFVICVLLSAGCYLFLLKTMTGKKIRATSQGPDAARLLGISIDRMSQIIFFLSSALSAAAGALLAPMFYLSPAMGFMPSLKGIVVIVLGGMGSIKGALVGGFILGIAESLGAGYISSMYKDAFAFGILLLVLLFKPSGLFQK